MRTLLRVALSWASLQGCQATLPVPETTWHPGEGFAIVPFPPPVARVEFIPPRPNEVDVWIDGAWEWEKQSFSWRAGRWESPPSRGARYAPATWVRSPNGPLYFYRGRWYRATASPAVTMKESP